MISNIELNQRITLKIGSTDYEITRETAELLYTKLGVMLNKQTNFELSYPSGQRHFDPSMTYGVATNSVALAKGNK
jgi:hypothetical protein